MHKRIMLFGRMGILLTLIMLSACSINPLAPTPTPSSEPSATPAPATLAPTEIPLPSDTSEPTSPPELAATQPISGTAALEPALTLNAATSLPLTPTTAVTQAAVNPAPAVADKALFVTQNFQDGYRFKPGTPVTIIWTVKNVGTTGWTTSYSLRYFAGEKSDKTSIPFPKTVPPGGEVSLSVNLVVPATLGSYTTWWKLANGEGQNFSDVDFHFASASQAGPPAVTPTP